MNTIKKFIHSTTAKAILAVGLCISVIVGFAGRVKAEETVQKEAEVTTEALEPALTLVPVYICAEGDVYDIVYDGYLSGVPEFGAEGAGLLMVNLDPSDSIIYNNPVILNGNEHFSFVQRVPGTTTYAGVTVTLGYSWGNLIASSSIEMPGTCKAYGSEQPPTEWAEPTVEVICGAEDMIHVPDDTDKVKYHVNGGPGYTNVYALWAFDWSILQKWEFTDNGEECVDVGEPPVPPTNEPEIKAIETVGECQTFTVTNTGNVVTGDTQFGVAFNQGNLPPTPVILEPGQSFSYDLAVGETVSLGFSDEGSFMVTGPVEYTAVDCSIVVEPPAPVTTEPSVTRGEPIFLGPSDPPPPNPAGQMLPETGSGSWIVVYIASIFVTIGVFLCWIRRRKSSSWT